MSNQPRIYEKQLRFEESLIGQHKILGSAVLPAAVQIEMVLAAMLGGGRLQPMELQDINFQSFFSLKPSQSGTLRLSLREEMGGWAFELRGSSSSQGRDETWRLISSGWGRIGESKGRPFPWSLNVSQELMPETIYARFMERGIAYGSDFRTINSLQLGDGCSEASLVLPATSRAATWYFHPLLLDGTFQSLSCAVQSPIAAENLEVFVPLSIDRLRLLRPISPAVRVQARRISSEGDLATGEIAILGNNGELLAELQGVRMKRSRSLRRSPPVADRKSRVSTPTTENNGALRREIRWEMSWVPTPQSGTRSVPNGTWLVFTDKRGIGERLCASLRSRGNRVIEVMQGEQYQQLSEQRVALPANNAEAYKRLLDDIGQEVAGIVHLWNSEDFGSAMTAQELESRLDQGVYSVFHLVQNLAQRQRTVELWLVTVEGQPINIATSQLSPAKAALWGLGRVIKVEHSGYTVRLVDLPATAVGDQQETLLKELFGADQSPEVGYRKGTRYLPSIAPVPLSGSARSNVAIRKGGRYLIVGGQGGIGLVLARHFADAGAGVLILMNRSPLTPSREESIRALEAQGVRVWAAQGDVSTLSSLEKVFEGAERRFGGVDGVVHCAGLLRDGLLRTKKISDFANVLRPKVQGTWVLDRVLEGRKLDFVLLFGSVSGVLGNLGQGAYAAANTYQDAFAQLRRGAAGQPWTSLDWGLWGEVGMGVELVEQLRRRGIHPLSTREALAEVLPALEAGVPQRILAHLGGQHSNQEPKATASEEDRESSLAQMRREVQQYLSERLNHSDLEEDIPFSEFGIDSILGVSMTEELSEQWNRSLPATLFIEYANIEELASALVERFQLPDKKAAPTPSPSPNTRGGEKEGGEKEAPSPSVGRGQHPSLPEHPSLPSPSIGGGAGGGGRGGRGGQAVAVIAMSGRFPGAETLESYWQLIRRGGSAISEVPAERWDVNAWYEKQSPDIKGTYGRWGGFLSDINSFDPSFFRISHREARTLDPQQRLALEEVWKVLENGGMVDQREIGVFVAATYTHHRDKEGLELVGPYSALGSMNALLANRISYTLDLKGPSLTIDTLCSSSLVAIHQALLSLQRGDCRAAIVASVQVGLTPWYYRSLSQLGALSSTGACRPFDQAANGFVPGEGVAAVLLKPLSDAIRDGDHVWGVIRGSAVNHGGRASGLTVPGKTAQTEVIRAALNAAGLQASDIGLLEAHGTGTTLGDPIEFEALTEAFSKDTHLRQFCAIGSVKANIGHLEPAAGMAGLIKVLLAFRAGEIPPATNFSEPNDRISFENTPFYVPDMPLAWNDTLDTRRPRRAGISSFGMGGTNAHIIVEPPPSPTDQEYIRTSGHILALSARSQTALLNKATELRSWLEEHVSAALEDFSFSVNVGRGYFKHRLAIIGRNRAELLQGLELAINDESDQAANQTHSRIVWAHDSLVQSPQLAQLINLAQQYVGGENVDWRDLYQSPVQRLPLPTYPFNRSSLDTSRSNVQQILYPIPTDLSLPIWAHHRVGNRPMFPASAFVGLAVEVAQQVQMGLPLWLEEFVFPQPLSEISFSPQLQGIRDGERLNLTLSKNREIYMRGTLQPATGQVAEGMDPSTLRRLCQEEVPVGEIYQWFERRGMHYGPSMQALRRVWRGAGIVFAELEGQNTMGQFKLRLEPSLVDGALQAMAALTMIDPKARHLAYRPFSLKGVRVEQPAQKRAFCFLQSLPKEGSEHSLHCQLTILDEEGNVIVRFERVVYRATPMTPQPTKGTSRRRALPTQNTQRQRIKKRRKTVNLESLLHRLVGSVLETPEEQISSSTSFSELGLDSILATTLATKLEQQLGETISPTMFLDHQNIEEVAQQLLTNGVAVPESLIERQEESAQVQQFKESPQVQPFEANASGQDATDSALGQGATANALGLDVADSALGQVLEYLGQTEKVAPPSPPQPPSPSGRGGSNSRSSPFFSPLAPRERGVGGVRAGWQDASNSTINPTKAESVGPELSPALEGAIAVIGMACTFPNADHPQTFWTLLREGEDLVGEVPRERWDINAFYNSSPYVSGTTYSRWGAFLEDVASFDAKFFDLYPRQAEVMDPQQRLLLQTTWKALEDAALAGGQLAASKTGVYVATSYQHYREYNIGPKLDAYSGLGNHNAILANRLSYFLDLKGPCMTVDTLCSSSLVALHMATRSLRDGECEQALVAGVQVGLSPWHYQSMSRLKALSPQGRCRTFDAGADGFVPGEGVGVLLLKPLQAAWQDGDRIEGVILGSAVNHGGRSSGLTVPSSSAQRDVILEALKDAGVSAESIGYVEAHGTGTSLGDPIEVEGLTAAYRQSTEKRQFCAIGSVKTNIGHLEPAAGIAGTIKALLALQHGQIPPTLHIEEANERINFEDSPFYVNDRLSSWPRRVGTINQSPRRAGVSAFGLGGVNAHVILQEAPAHLPRGEYVRRSVEVVRLSGVESEAVPELASLYASHFENLSGEEELSDACYTANTGRGHFPYRVALVGKDKEELSDSLRAVAEGNHPVRRLQNQRPKVAFLYTDHGAQDVAMGRALYQTELVFRESLQRSASLLSTTVPLLELLHGDSDARLEQIEYAHPALFALQYALYELLSSWGVEPDLVIGHGVGEYTAACVAGVLTLQEALSLVAARARLMQAQQEGGAVGRFDQEFEALLANVQLMPPAMPFLTTEGQLSDSEIVSPRHWSKGLVGLVQPITGENGRRAALEAGAEVIWELGINTSTIHQSPNGSPVRLVTLQQGRDAHRSLLESLCHYYNLGLGELDWSAVENLPGRRRRAIPHYPFQKQHYWREATPPADSKTGRADTQKPSGQQETTKQVPNNDGPKRAWQLEWRAEPAPSKSAPITNGCVLILEDKAGVGRNVAKQLHRDGARPILVRTGRAWAQIGEDLYEMDPTSEKDLGQLEKLISSRHAQNLWRGALCLWELDSWHGAAENIEHVEGALKSGIEVLRRVAAGIAAGIAAPVGSPPAKLLLATRNGQVVLKNEAAGLCIHRPPLIHLVQVLGRELPGVRCLSIDLAPSVDLTPDEAKKDADRLLRAFHRQDRDAEIAWRDEQRYVRVFSPLNPTEGRPSSKAIDLGGTYLVTGGLGGVGAELAMALVAQGASQLVITGRTELPPSHAWSEWLKRQETDDSVRVKLQRLLDLERSGAKVSYIRSDVGQPEDVRTLFTRIRKEVGPLQGIVHAAGVAGAFGSLIRKSWADCEQVLRPKIMGSLLLAQEAAQEKLDFLIFVSSIAGVSAPLGRGLGDYAVANRFLDAFATKLRALGLGASSHAWSEWENVGLSKVGTLGRETEKLALAPLAANDARQLFVDCLNHGPANVVLLQPGGEFNANYFLQQRTIQPSVLSETPSPTKRGDSATKIKIKIKKIEEIVRETVRETLKISGSEPDWSRPFGELGMDSLALADAITRLEQQYGKSLDPSMFLRQPNLHQLASFLLEQYGVPGQSEGDAANDLHVASRQVDLEAKDRSQPDLEETFQHLLQGLRAGKTSIVDAEAVLKNYVQE